MAYFTLISRSVDETGAKWSPQFGDYDRETVEFELADMKGADRLDKSRNLYRIIRTASARQSEITLALAKLNAGL